MSPSRRSFHRVVDDLELIAEGVLRGRTSALPDWVSEARLHQSFRRSTKLGTRQRYGAFFTSQPLSRQVLRNAPASATVCDIACGTGSLLLTHSDRLNVHDTLDETLDYWGERLLGREVQELLLRVARARIVIAAAMRFIQRKGTQPETHRRYDDLFPNLKTENGLRNSAAIQSATDIVLNPPFTPMTAPNDCPWSEGTINSAAWFVHHCLIHAKPAARITAVLPDVLRSGERYGKWRGFIESRARVAAVETVGRFDQHADVDVFVLRLTVKSRPTPYLNQAVRWVAQPGELTIGDFFDVSVGAVVSYRTPNDGPWRPYLDVSNADAWGRVKTVDKSRRFKGKIEVPPFIVVRRTSSPSDRLRAIPTIVTDRRNVAVENHLLVLAPLDRTIETCREAVDILRGSETTRWLNERIRCRHLTVESVREIPWLRS